MTSEKAIEVIKIIKQLDFNKNQLIFINMLLKTIKIEQQKNEKERDKWLEERGRMSKLLFEKGIKSW